MINSSLRRQEESNRIYGHPTTSMISPLPISSWMGQITPLKDIYCSAKQLSRPGAVGFASSRLECHLVAEPTSASRHLQSGLLLWWGVPAQPASPVAGSVKSLPATQDCLQRRTTCSAGDSGSTPESEAPLEEEMATPSSVLAWEIPWTEPGGLQSMGSSESDTT